MAASSGSSGTSSAAENQAPKPDGGKVAAGPAPARRGSFASSAPPTPESSDPGALDSQASSATAAADDGAVGGEPGAPASSADAAEGRKALGNKAFRDGRYNEAIQLFSAALELRPGTAVYLGNRAAAYLMARRYPEAVQDSLAALELDPGFSKAYARAGAVPWCWLATCVAPLWLLNPQPFPSCRASLPRGVCGC